MDDINMIVVPVIEVHHACKVISNYISREEIISLLNAYIRQYKIEVEQVSEDDTRKDWQLLCDTVDQFNGANQIDFLTQIINTNYVQYKEDYAIVAKFRKI